MISFKAYNNELKFIDKHITETPIGIVVYEKSVTSLDKAV